MQCLDSAPVLVTFTIPKHDLAEFAGLQDACKKDVRQKLDVMSALCSLQGRGITSAIALHARCMDMSPKRLRSLYDAFRNGTHRFPAKDWRILINRAKWPEETPAMPRAFVDWWQTQCEKHQRGSAGAYDDLCKRYRQWRRGDESAAIPGFDQCPNPYASTGMPVGMSYSNLTRKTSSEMELKVMRRGLQAAHALLPQTFTTRVGLWPGSHYMFDDLRHDGFVLFGRKPEAMEVVRVDELDALDVFSADKFAWGFKPRWRREDGSEDGLKERSMRFMLAHVLFNFGYSPRGTVLMAEHGTAAIRERIEKLFRDYGLPITVRRSGIVGEEQAVLDMWKGPGKGNPRFKSPLESLRNLIHNRLDALPGQTGRNPDERPEMTAGILDYENALLKAASRIAPEKAALLIHPLLKFHSEFVPIVEAVYRAINTRDNHDLEGWERIGGFGTEYRLAPATEEWISPEDYLALPPESRAAIAQLAQLQPRVFSRTRRLSPAEMFARGSGDLVKIGPDIVCEILAADLAVERAVAGSYFVFDDIEVDPQELIYHARIVGMDNRERELRDGDKFQTFVNPFNPDWLFVRDAKGGYLGMAPRYHRACRGDEKAIQNAWAWSETRKVDRLAGVRSRHADSSKEVAAMRTHNAEVLSGAPVTPEEKSESRDESRRKNSAARFGRALAGSAETNARNGEEPLPSVIEEW